MNFRFYQKLNVLYVQIRHKRTIIIAHIAYGSVYRTESKSNLELTSKQIFATVFIFCGAGRSSVIPVILDLESFPSQSHLILNYFKLHRFTMIHRQLQKLLLSVLSL